ncbi:MAG: hypothetical protein AVDCRST_MAG35-45, partial [uncultured Quadrisphaera sp.]
LRRGLARPRAGRRPWRQRPGGCGGV